MTFRSPGAFRPNDSCRSCLLLSSEYLPPGGSLRGHPCAAARHAPRCGSPQGDANRPAGPASLRQAEGGSRGFGRDCSINPAGASAFRNGVRDRDVRPGNRLCKGGARRPAMRRDGRRAALRPASPAGGRPPGLVSGETHRPKVDNALRRSRRSVFRRTATKSRWDSVPLERSPVGTRSRSGYAPCCLVAERYWDQVGWAVEEYAWRFECRATLSRPRRF